MNPRIPSLACLLALTCVLTACVAHEQPPPLPRPGERVTSISMVFSVSKGIRCPPSSMAYRKRSGRPASIVPNTISRSQKRRRNWRSNRSWRKR